MNKITESLKQHLKTQKCAFEIDRKKEIVYFGITGDKAKWRCLGCADEAGGFVLLSLIPLMAPEPRRSACAELLVRINWRIGLGHFDMDFNDGELRFMSTVPLGEDDGLSEEVIGRVICGHQTLVDAFIPAISAVLFADVAPEKAIEQNAQKKTESPMARISLN